MKQNTTFKRIVWDKFLLLFCFLSFIPVEGWLIYSMSKAKEIDSLLLWMVVLVSTLLIFLLILNIYLFLMKNDAITLEYPFVIIRTFNERRIPYKDIKDIRYISDGSGRGRKGGFSLSLGLYKSGTIVFYLNDGRRVKARGIKEVRKACLAIRKEILER